MRTRVDFVCFLLKELAPKFTTDSYDVLTHNCNHFTDAACLFLLNRHIPQEVLTQAELFNSAWTVQLLRPVLNRALGRFEAGGTAKELESTTKMSWNDSTDLMTLTDEDCHTRTLVVWEHFAGWTRIGCLLSRCRQSQTCAVKWIDMHTGKFNTEVGVKWCRVQRLESCIGFRGKHASDPMVGGKFGARYHSISI